MIGRAPCRSCAPLALLAALVLTLPLQGREPPALRVCADPDNLPFSSVRGDGFENRLAELLARELGRPLAYTWRPQQRGFLRETLDAGRCDVVIGVPTQLERLDTTRPYYRSTYVFVTRRDRHLQLRSLDDAALRRLRIGVPLIGDDGANAPPAHALARRGIVRNVVGYSVQDHSRGVPALSTIVTAVASGDVDVATVWGPAAGYFAARASDALDIRPITAGPDAARFPVAFDISMGVRRGDAARLAQLEAFLDRRQPEIARLLDAYHVPRLPLPELRR